jgi:hypothetical protein
MSFSKSNWKKIQPSFYYNVRYHKQGEQSNKSKGSIKSTIKSSTKSLNMRKNSIKGVWIFEKIKYKSSKTHFKIFKWWSSQKKLLNMKEKIKPIYECTS